MKVEEVTPACHSASWLLIRRWSHRGVGVLHLPDDLLGQVQVQVDVLLLAADGVVALAASRACGVLAQDATAGALLLPPRVGQVGQWGPGVKGQQRAVAEGEAASPWQ